MSGSSLNSSSRFANHFKTEYSDKTSGKGLNVYLHPDLTAIIEIIKGKFYFATLLPGTKQPKGASNVYLFDIDQEFVYNNFYNDFGPLNIACLYKYCHGINQILQNPKHKSTQIVHFTSTNAEKRANAAYLVASYSVLCLNKSPEEVYHSFSNKDTPCLKPFQDASVGDSIYTINLLDCLKALSKAAALGFFHLDDFDVREYEKYEQIKNGDLNWIVPRKFLAFIGPSTENNAITHYPEKYLNYFMKNEVVAVVRLNRRAYESFRFTNAGILHYDLFFPDGTVPPKKILKQFMHIAESTRGAIAVHCKAGLGRTGTLIAAYLMKHYRMSARETIAWLRICRPGSVIGQQQSWLEEMQDSLWRDGRRYRIKNLGDENLIPFQRRGIYSIAAKYDRKVRFRDYKKNGNVNKASSEDFKLSNKYILPDVNARCSSAREINNNRISEVVVPSLKPEDIRNKFAPADITQGDKLNEIKMKRKKPNVH